ncbi:transposase IS4 family protein [Candidatus Thiomargarita nelsonii]|uniref:Transposase IS4 family protein n=1 Tax=Candidatus Thiomargarita nelsonii TaxID=1003181 RepID=A0A176S3R3_9GAMM|nr:transposase IS4 family protein [Candidatus Thiomargarita nelsonii]
MSTIKHLAEEVNASLKAALPTQRKTQRDKLSLAIAAAFEARTGNTAEIANLLPLETKRSDMRYQWLSRLLANEHIEPDEVMSPFAKQSLKEACQHGERIILSIDQSSIANRHSLLMVSVRYGERALPVLWCVSPGKGNMAFADYQERLLDQVRTCLPEKAQVLILGDRFYGTVDMIRYCQKAGWHYRLRLKSTLLVYTGSESTTTGEIARRARQKRKRGIYFKEPIFITDQLVSTYLGVLHESGHKEAWIIAMDVPASSYSVRDYGLRWSIENWFSDFKTRGFNLEKSQLNYPDRLSRLILIISLAIHWAARTGRMDSLENPLPLERAAQQNPDNDSIFRRAARRVISWFKRGIRLLLYKAQCLEPLPMLYDRTTPL